MTLSNGTIFYDPTHASTLQALNAGQSLPDTFTYTIDDGHGGTNTATVTLDVDGRNEAGLVTTGGGTWGFTAAWSPQVVPGSGNDVLVSGGPISSLDDSVAAHSLTISSGAVVLTGGAAIAIGGDLTMSSSSITTEVGDIAVSHSDETRSLSLLNGSNLVTASGGIVAIGGSFSGFEVSGNSSILADGHISIDAALLGPFTDAFAIGSSDPDDHSTILAKGSVTINGVVTNDDFFIGAGATLLSQNDFVSIGTDIGDDFINRGFITALANNGSPSGDIFINSEIAGTFTNSGEISASRNVSIGREIGHGFSNTGTIHADNNLTIDAAVAGNFTNDGTIHAGNVLTITGSIEGFFNGETGTIEAGTLNIGDVGAAFENSGTVSVSGFNISEIDVDVHNTDMGEFQVSGGRLDLGNVHNDGVIRAFEEGHIVVSGTADGTGSFVIQDGVIEFADTVSSDLTVAFSSGTSDELVVDDIGMFHAHITGFGSDDGIDLVNVDPTHLEGVSFANGTLSLQVDGDTINVEHIEGVYRPGNFAVQSDFNGNDPEGTRIAYTDVLGSPVDWHSSNTDYGVAFNVTGFDPGQISVDFGDGNFATNTTTIQHTYDATLGFTGTMTISLDGNDTIYNVVAPLTLVGASTQLTGATGNDLLIANPQAATNTFDGKEGDDILYAARDHSRSDTFVFKQNGGHDVLVGYGAEDTLDFSDFSTFGITSFMNSHAVDTAAGTLITLDADTSVLIQGVLKANIDQSHILGGGG